MNATETAPLAAIEARFRELIREADEALPGTLAGVAIRHATMAHLAHLRGQRGIRRVTFLRYLDMATSGDGFEVLQRLIRYAHYRPVAA